MTDEPSRQPTGKRRSSRSGKPRMPHNARLNDYGSLDELLAKVGDERRPARIQGEDVEITRREANFRLQVNRALDGKIRDLADILRVMKCYPDVARSYLNETVIFISGVDADA